MTLTPDQLHDLLNMMRVQMLIFAGSTNGTQSLSTEEINLLTAHGVDIGELYKVTDDPILLNFHLGLLSQAIGQTASQNITFDQLKKYIQSNRHIPLTQREIATINSIKNQSLADIRAHQGKIFQDINGVINHHQTSERAGHEDFIRENIAQGLIDNKTARQISVDLARLTGDWSRNFYKSVQYICHAALNEGRLAMIQRREGNSGQVYFQVQKDACPSCVKLYLTTGEGSEPRIFNVNDLLANGNNIGKKQVDWKATIGPIHPHSITEGRTLVLTDNGWERIDKINVGDYVLTHKGRFRKVLSVLKNFVADQSYKNKKIVYITYLIKTKHGIEKTKISVTEEHKILTQLGWVEAINLDVNIHKVLKLMKPCSCGCGEYVDVISNGKRTFSNKCKAKISAINASKLTKNTEIVFKISETVKARWDSMTIEEREEKNRILKSEIHKQKNRERMLNGGAIKARNGRDKYSRSSKAQIKLFEKVKKIYPDAELEYEIYGKFLDIAIPSLKVDIEYDGKFWHSKPKNAANDIKRDELLKSNGWHVVRYIDSMPGLKRIQKDVELVANNSLELYRFEEIPIESIKYSTINNGKRAKNNKIRLFDIEVEEDESFVARGIVIHNCRCLLTEHIEGEKWIDGRFTIPKEPITHPRIDRKKVRIIFNNKEYFV